MSLVALIVAAGRGVRFGPDVRKQFASLAGKSVILHSIQLFERMDEFDSIWLVLPRDMIDRAERDLGLGRYKKVGGSVEGGARRQDSVRAGLRALPAGTEIVAVHDAVRPLAAPEAVSEAVARARRMGAAILASPVVDTIKRCDAGARVIETLDRRRLWLAQTPQVFRYDLIARAYEEAFAHAAELTDDAAAVERLGEPVEVIVPPRPNPKITTPDDLAYAEWLLARRRLS